MVITPVIIASWILCVTAVYLWKSRLLKRTWQEPYFADTPVLIAELTHAGLAAARAWGRKGGRPRKMDRSTLMMAMTALADTNSNATDVVKKLGITTTTLIYVNGDGSVKAAGQVILNQNSDEPIKSPK